MPARTAPLPGLEDQRIEEVRDAAVKYAEIRDRRMALTKKEIEAKQDLLDTMHEHGMTRYFDSEAEVLAVIEKKADENVRVNVGETAIEGAAKLAAEKPVEDMKDAIDGVTPGQDEPIEKKTMKSSKKKGGE